MKYEIKEHLAGTKNAYWILRVFMEGRATPIVHTGKGRNGYSYVANIRKNRYPNATRI